MMPFLVAQANAVASAPQLMPSVTRTLLGLAVVLALLGGLAWILRKSLLLKKGGSGLGVESALALGERRSLVVVSVEGRRLLLGLAPNSVSLVTELGSAPSFESAVSTALSTEPDA